MSKRPLQRSRAANLCQGCKHVECRQPSLVVIVNCDYAPSDDQLQRDNKALEIALEDVNAAKADIAKIEDARFLRTVERYERDEKCRKSVLETIKNTLDILENWEEVENE